MRIRAIEVQHWACIDSLKLGDLPDGIVVLHGPNRTGKSSLVQAVRSCLFDHEHTSKDSVVLSAIPRRSQETPRVSVEFEAGGRRYRITKAFATGKEGHALLEEQTSAGWTVLEKGREAARRTREIIGIEKSKGRECSESGLYQLLWLKQGEIRLPQPRDVDVQLSKAMEAVLGSMVTGRDVDFEQRLKKACEPWFTPTMRDRDPSPLTELRSKLAEAERERADTDRQLAEADDLLRRYEGARELLPKLQEDEKTARLEAETLSTQCTAVRERQYKHRLALKEREQAVKHQEQSTQRLQEFDRVQGELECGQRKLAELQKAQEAASADLAAIQAEAATTDESLQQAQSAVQQHQQGQADLDDRQQLVNFAVQLEKIEQTLTRAAELAARHKELEDQLAGPPALSEKQIKSLQENRREAGRLRAQLEAAELRLGFDSEAAVRLEVAIDGQAAVPCDLPPQARRDWLVRQRAELHLPGVGTLRIARGQADRSLDEQAARLDSLEAAFAKEIRAAQGDPADPDILTALTTRRLEHERCAADLMQLRDELLKLAPTGLPALQAQRQTWLDQRQSLLLRRPELCDWPADPRDLDARRAEFTRRSQELGAAVERARLLHDAQRQRLQAAQSRTQQLKEQLAGVSAELTVKQEQLTKLGSRPALAQACDEAAAALANADAQVQATALTEEEKNLDAHLQQAETASRQRTLRLQEHEKLMVGLEVQLRGTEGLHQKRINAEQACNELKRDLDRLELQAAAHKRLRELFEQVRREQVKRTVGPISERVLKWCRQLGIADYDRLDFGEQYFPKGLVPKGASADHDPVELECESYGTLEQLGLLVRLAVGGLLAKSEPAVAILDDPLVSTDDLKHRRMLDILSRAARGGDSDGGASSGPLQLLIFTWRPERFDFLDGIPRIDLGREIKLES